MVSWYLEQGKPDSTVNRNINAVRKDAIISTITNMLQVCFNYFYIIPANVCFGIYILIIIHFSFRIVPKSHWTLWWVCVKI